MYVHLYLPRQSASRLQQKLQQLDMSTSLAQWEELVHCKAAYFCSHSKQNQVDSVSTAQVW